MGLERGLAMGLMVLWQAAELRLLEAVGLVQSGQGSNGYWPARGSGQLPLGV